MNGMKVKIGEADWYSASSQPGSGHIREAGCPRRSMKGVLHPRRLTEKAKWRYDLEQVLNCRFRI